MFKVGRDNHGVGNLSVGYQYFPINVPSTTETIHNGETHIYSVDNDWWYFNGPGARLEVKLTLGGFF